MQEEVRIWILSEVSSADVFLFTKSYCKFSKAVKAALLQHRIPFRYCDIDLQTEFSTASVQAQLMKMNGISTVPQVYLNGDFFGDSERTLAALASGEFQKDLL